MGRPEAEGQLGFRMKRPDRSFSGLPAAASGPVAERGRQTLMYDSKSDRR